MTGDAVLRAALRDRLAPWAVPGRFIRLQALPRLANHKLDRKALAALADNPGPASEALAAGSDLLSQVVRTVREVSGMAIGPDDRFDACGIDSLHAVQILSALQHGCGRPLLPALVGLDSTPRRIAHHLRNGAGHEGRKAPVLLKLGCDPQQSPLLVMADVEGDFRHVGRLVHALPDLRGCVGFAEADREVPDAPEDRLVAIATRAAAAIMEAGLRPPYALLGYSFGGRVAYAVGVQLRALGHAVSFLGLIDTTLRTTNFHPPLPDDTMPPEVRRQAARLWLRAEASRLYRPEPSDLPVTLFQSASRLPSENATLGWNEVVPNVQLVSVSGNHAAMLHPPHLGALAQAVVTMWKRRLPSFDVAARQPAAVAQAVWLPREPNFRAIQHNDLTTAFEAI